MGMRFLTQIWLSVMLISSYCSKLYHEGKKELIPLKPEMTFPLQCSQEVFYGIPVLEFISPRSYLLVVVVKYTCVCSEVQMHISLLESFTILILKELKLFHSI